MILGVDIGNTTIYFGVIENDEVINSFRITTKKDITEEEYEIVIKNVLEENVEKDKIKGIIIASVVPEITSEVEEALFNIVGVKPVVLKKDITSTLNMDKECVRALGADLIADATGAIAKYKTPIIIFDMGTATTCSVVNKDGTFMGGMICPRAKNECRCTY